MTAEPSGDDLVRSTLAPLLDGLVQIRRDLHQFPEPSHGEVRTTAVVVDRLTRAGLHPRPLPGTGLVCDIGEPSEQGWLALRADLDALPLNDETGTEWASAKPGLAHACGHDVHTTVLLGTGLVLAEWQRKGLLPFGVRLVFQPAEESAPSGAPDVIAAGVLEGVARILALHCAPDFEVGTIGLKVGPITSASDRVVIRLTGDGGHTSRPHLTGDLIYALGEVATKLPAALARRLDPRSGVSMVWGRIRAGAVANVIPRSGTLEGTLRCLQIEDAEPVVRQILDALVQPYQVRAELEYHRQVPPVINDAASIAMFDHAARSELGEESVLPTQQSLGGEDFAWYLDHVPGALARLGTRVPGGPVKDLHRGDFDVDEDSIQIGVRLLCAVVLHGHLTPWQAAGMKR